MKNSSTPSGGRSPRKISRNPGRSVTTEEIEREMMFRTWFPKDLKFEPEGMSDADVQAVLDAFTAFAAANIWVKIPGKRIPLVLRDAQLETLRDWIGNRKTIVLKARQIGFSTLIAAFSLWCAMAGTDRNIYLLSKGQREARSLLSKARYAYRNIPAWVRERPGTPKLEDKTVERMTFDNDSFLISAPSASDPIRGETAWLAVIDEWASLPDQEGAWASVEPTSDLGGRIIGLSTAKGQGDFFHATWVGAEVGENGFVPIFHSWRAVPDRDDAWYETKKAENPAWFVHQEYPDSPEEAFIGSGNPFFDLDVLNQMVVVPPLLTVDPQMAFGEPVMKPVPEGDLWIWEYPNSKKAYAVGADVAMGLDHGDWSVAYVMEAKSRKIVAWYRGKCSPSYFGEQILQAIGLYYGDALMCPEVNNHGLTTTQALMNDNYPNMYRRRTKLQRREQIMESVGFQTNSSTKPAMMDKVQDWLLQGGKVYDKVTLAELKTFVRETRGDRVKLHGSPHDDCTMALGLTMEAVQYAVENDLAVPKMSSEGSISWWEKKLSKAGSKKRLSAVM